MITLDPWLLLVALAFLVPWGAARLRLRCWFYKVRLSAAVWRMRRKHRATILVHTGHINRGVTVKLTRKVRLAPQDRPLVLVLDTCGGEMPAAQHLLRCLAQHPGQVVVRVPDECWSAGTVIACGADLIVLGPDGNLGPTDSIAHVDPSEIRCGPAVTAAETSRDVGLVRAEHAQRDIIEAITMARVQRGMEPAAARTLACRLTASDTDHHQPIFHEDAVELGFAAAVDPDEDWFHLVHLSSWSGQ